MYPDDVYLARLSDVTKTLESWAYGNRDVATWEVAATSDHWKLTVEPQTSGACAFELVLRADQMFDLQIDSEVYADKRVDKFEYFAMLARAIAAGHVERVEISSSLTGALESVETRVTLEDGWAWIGERRIISRIARRNETAQELRSHRFLPYRR